MDTFVLPGTAVGNRVTYEPGYGVSQSDRDKLIATRAGYTKVVIGASGSKPQICVVPTPNSISSALLQVPSTAPQVSDWVIARVTRLQQLQVNLEILQIDPNTPKNCGKPKIRQEAFKIPYKAILRSYDVRSTERDRVKVEELFRPGDIVRAEVVSSILKVYNYHADLV